MITLCVGRIFSSVQVCSRRVTFENPLCSISHVVQERYYQCPQPFRDMSFLSSLMPGKRAVAADQSATMGARLDPTQSPIEPNKVPQQATRRMTSAVRIAAGNVENVDTAHDDMMLDNVDEGKEVYAAKQTGAQNPPKRSRDVPQGRASARIAGRPEEVEQKPIGPHASSRTQYQESSNPRTLGRPGQPQQANIQMREDFRWNELPNRVDALSADMKNVLGALWELKQDKHEKVALQKELQEAQNELRKSNVALGDSEQDEHEKMALQKNLQETQHRLQETTTTLEAVRKSWRKAASQLGQFQPQGTGLYQLTDSDLTASVMQLRYAIRDFSVQYFTGTPPKRQPGNPPGGDFWKYMDETTTRSDEYKAYLRSETRSPIVIQSFLWGLLVGEIFGGFCWAPWLKKSVTHVYQTLQPRKCL